MTLFIVLLLVVGSLTVNCQDSWVPFSPNPYYYKYWCGHGTLEYLEDAHCQKVFPGSFDRDYMCKSTHAFIPFELGYRRDATNASLIRVDTTTLGGLGIPYLEQINLALIMIRRSAVDGQVYYRYLSNGRHDIPVETWSSSKIFCMADAGGVLSLDCAQPPNQPVGGLDAATQGKWGTTLLGDLATIITTYDTTRNYTSNSLAKWFATVGGHARLNELVQGPWLGRGTNESLGGSYGEPIPADLGFTFFSPIGQPSIKQSRTSSACTVTPDFGPIASDTLSAFSQAEMVRRLVLNREVPAVNRFPGMTWQSTKDVLYGADASVFFPGTAWGGMSANIDIFVQSGLNMTQVELQSAGQWRIFSKLGDGDSTAADGTSVGQIVTNNYACLPVVGGQSSGGVEFVLSARASFPAQPGQGPLASAQYPLQQCVAAIVQLIANGTIQ